jgi:uncharacterized protein involved in high-affinity Fe2+ transport
MKFKKVLFMIMAAAMAVAMGVFLSACGDSDKDNNTDGDEPGGGFEEFDLGDAKDFDNYGISVAGVYFQAVDMVPAGSGLTASASDIHIEADISALAGNNLGFGAGDFVPFLTVNYEIYSKEGAKLHEGTFMQMNASDGPHYGANVILGATKGQQGTYKIKFSIEAPGESYLLHSDAETGVTGRFWETALTVEWTFDFVPFSA